MTKGEHGLSPICLIVPGLGDSGPGHWQTRWEQRRRDCRRVPLGLWDDPIRNVWIGRIDQAVRAAPGPVVLVAHSLGCQAVAWWARLLGAAVPRTVIGALLVAPPDLARAGLAPPLARFAPTPEGALPFPTIVVASSDDPYSHPDRAASLADGWAAELVLLEGEGHINAASGLADWPEGQELPERLIDGPSRLPVAMPPAPVSYAAPRVNAPPPPR